MAPVRRDRVERDLAGLVRGDVRCDVFTRALYSTDASMYQIEPLAVVAPRDAADVVAVVQYAAAHGISLHPRGAGSGLAGECLGRGIVLDTTKYMNRIESVEGEDGRCTVQAGVVLDVLNERVRGDGLLFGPDPSSGTRATLGGMIANNATGAHSLIYGYTGDYVEALEVVLADGTQAVLSAVDRGSDTFAEWQRRDTVLGRAAATLPQLIEANREEIVRHTPKCYRNRAGYVLNRVVDNGSVDFTRLISGSEGTLAVVTGATLRLVPRPPGRCVVMLCFAGIDRAAQCVPPLLETGPSAIELLDGFVLTSARESGRAYGALLPPDTKSVLLVEFHAASRRELEEAARQTENLALHRLELAKSAQSAFEAGEIELIWSLRNAGNPLLYRARGPRQAIAFIEDAAVPPADLPEYLRQLAAILEEEGVPYASFGHAAHGELHTRPFLDLRRDEDIDRMERIADRVCDLVLRLGGTISGEHGDGLARVQFLPRQYGPLMETFKKIKATFDPKGILNPGKILNDDPHAIRHNLRYGSGYDWRKRNTVLIWRDDELRHEIEKCNGCADCRSVTNKVTMCPVFRVTLDEEASPRAKANLMRLFMTGQIDDEWRYSDEFKRIADLCVNCKMCHLECPAQVNIPKLMMEAKAEWAQRRGQPIVNQVLTRSETMSKVGALTAPLANLSLGLAPLRAVMEWVTGIDRRRLLPAFNARPFLRRAPEAFAPAEPKARVAYFVDLFANYNDPDLGQAVVDVLRANDIEVIVPRGQKGCAMPQIDYGAVKRALPQIRHNVELLADVVRDGYTIVSSEPTATLCLKEEYLDYDDSEAAHLVAGNTRDVCELLFELYRQGQLKDYEREVPIVFGYHAPCHLKALNVGRPGMALVDAIPETEVRYIDAGCCGIAGTFGFKKAGFDLSMQAGQGLFRGLAAEDIVYGLSECSTCKMQMEQGSGKPTLHPIKVMAHAYGLLDTLPGMTVLRRRERAPSTRSAS